MLKACTQNLMGSLAYQDLMFNPKLAACFGTMGMDHFHRNCISGNYPGSNVKRFTVPENIVFWSVAFPEYSPVPYTSENLKNADYADPDINDRNFCPKWNAIDGGTDRRSHTGIYEIVDNLPRNPIGRTGIIGRGKLGKWGPNHAADPIVTRWKTDKAGNKHHNSDNKPILQFVAIQRSDNDEWAFPGGMVEPGEIAKETVMREFCEETMDHRDAPEKDKKINEHLIKTYMNNGKEVFRDYVDDPRNTDNAWIETVAINFHDNAGNNLANLRLRSGSDAKAVKWMDVNKDLKLYANHSEILRKVADRWQAHW